MPASDPPAFRGPWSPDDVTEFLRGAVIPVRVGVDAGPGGPLVLSVWFLPDGVELVGATRPTSTLVRCLERRPECGFEVAADTPPYRGVRGRGRVELDRTGGAETLDRLLTRYLGGVDNPLGARLRADAEDEVGFRIRPVSLTSWTTGTGWHRAWPGPPERADPRPARRACLQVGAGPSVGRAGGAAGQGPLAHLVELGLAATCWATRVAWIPWNSPSSHPTSWAWAMRSSASEGVSGVERDRHPVELGGQVGGEAVRQLADRLLVDLAEPTTAGLVERGLADLLQQLLHHRADAEQLGRLLDRLRQLLGLAVLGTVAVGAAPSGVVGSSTSGRSAPVRAGAVVVCGVSSVTVGLLRVPRVAPASHRSSASRGGRPGGSPRCRRGP